MPDYKEIREQLLTMLPALLTDPNALIQYGQEDHPEYDQLAAFRIRLVATPGGDQLCIKHMHLGMEGSGEYYGQDFEAIIGRFLERLAHFHRPTRFSALIKTRKKYVLKLMKTYDIVTLQDLRKMHVIDKGERGG